jgi:C1A family cysteine protease
MRKELIILLSLLLVLVLADYLAVFLNSGSEIKTAFTSLQTLSESNNNKIILNPYETLFQPIPKTHSTSTTRDSASPKATGDAVSVNAYAADPSQYNVMSNNGTNLQVNYQTGSMNVSQNEFFNFTVSVKCKSNCTNLVLALDPVSSEKFSKEDIDYAQKELDKINAQIEQTNTGWQAALSDYFIEYTNKMRKGEIKLASEDDIKKDNAKNLLEIASSDKIRQMLSVKSAVTETEEKILPYYFDWRNAYNENWVTPVKSQGACGACWTFGAIAVAESALNIFNKWPTLQLDLAEQDVLSCSGGGTCGGGGDNLALDYIKNTGVVNEACFPYSQSDEICSNKCISSKQYHTGDKVIIMDWPSESMNKEEIIKYLLKYGPATKQIKVYTDLPGYSSGIYENTTSASSGIHIVTVVGYNETGDYFIVKNSWGSGWGMNGYFYAKSSIFIADPTLFDRMYFATSADKIDKGLVPMNSGSPFYTTTQNPYYCGNLTANQTCEVTWQVNATGFHLSNWTFFTIVNSDEENLTTDNSTITIIGNYIPEIQSIECQADSMWKPCENIRANKTISKVRVNVTDFDSNIVNVNLRLKENNVVTNENSAYLDSGFYVINTSSLLQENNSYKIETDIYDGYWINGFINWTAQPAGSCIENWTELYGNCTINDARLKYYADASSCNTTYNLPADNGTLIACDFCTPNWQNYNTTCINSNLTEYWLDSKICYEQTSLSSDLLGQPANQTLSCISQQCITVCSWTKCHRYCL